MRTCIGCRSKELKQKLLRVTYQVDTENRIVICPDEHNSIGGRGAWLHYDLTCYCNSIKKKSMYRSLRIADSAIIREEMFLTVLQA